MVESGFRLRRLRVTGEGLKPAEIEFADGLNVLTGPSNTGKSYVFRCIEYMLGGQSTPKEITESAGYSTAELEIVTLQGKSYTLRRSLKGGNTNLFGCKIDEITEDTEVEQTLAAKAHKTKTSVSSFLMSISGIGPMRVRTNQSDETENVTFRTLAQLFMVSETQILSERSPIHSDIVTENTKLESQFYAFITGVDDSSLIARPKKAVVEARVEGKEQLYDQLISEIQQQIDQIKTEHPSPSLPTIEQATAEINNSIESIGREMDKRLTDRKRISDDITEIDSRVLMLDELLFRFEVLQQHYRSDLKRLDFISEGENLIAQLQVAVCDSCGQALQSGKHSHSQAEQLVSVQEACRAESSKIQSHVSDLAATSISLQQERTELLHERETRRMEIEIVDKTIREELKPLLVIEQRRLRDWLDVRREYDRLELLQRNLRTYIADQASLKKNTRSERKTQVDPSLEMEAKAALQAETRQGALLKFCAAVTELLNQWKFAAKSNVYFDTTELDLVIDGVPRINNGKGVRALLYSAFAIALIHYSKMSGRSHPGIAVLDSPLTTLKEGADSSTTVPEEVSELVQQAFFSDLSQHRDIQVILMENKVPAEQLWKDINLVTFTKNRLTGRFGFFPLADQRLGH
ncbi:MAG TPA: AAA family ATPase [Oculatellaceae cyanobacterium]